MSTKLVTDAIFGTYIIPSSQIFFSRKNIFAMINHKPFLPGHVLVCSRRNVPKLSQLTEIQIIDLFASAQEIVKKLSDLNDCVYHITLQNGKQSGQTVYHVHLHLCPDFVDGATRRKQYDEKRSIEDMAIEADKYRRYFQQNTF